MSMRTCSYFNCLRGAVLLLLFYAVSTTYVLINKTEQDSSALRNKQDEDMTSHTARGQSTSALVAVGDVNNTVSGVPGTSTSSEGGGVVMVVVLVLHCSLNSFPLRIQFGPAT